MSCRICGGEIAESFTLREMMYGTGETFPYEQCGDCGTLQIVEVPTDLDRYYANNYYSFANTRLKLRQRLTERLMVALAKRGLPHRRKSAPQWVTMLPELSSNTRILDIGCGGGALLDKMADWGMRSLAGVDPFIEADINRPNGVSIRKMSLNALRGQYDLIMMNHSLEHVPGPAAMLTDAKRLLAPGGKLLVRIPVLGGPIWEAYKTNWVQLDPPRHLYSFTERGFRTLAESAGYRLTDSVYDSTGFALWGSEAINRGLHMNSPGVPGVTGPAVFTRGELAEFERRIHRMNADGQSDQGCFLMQAA